jgi:hypothetical protein
LFFGRRFFDAWFGEFGCTGIFFVGVSLPLALVLRSSRRRRDGVSGVRRFL